MKKARLIHYTEYTLILLQGVIATFLLFSMIFLMSASRVNTNKLPVIVELLIWKETQTEVKKNMLPELKPAPKKKKSPIRKQKIIPEKTTFVPAKHYQISKKLTPKTCDKIIPVVQTEPRGNNTPPRKTLPNPVPLFKITEMPQFLHREVPTYPEAMRSMGKSCVVILDVLIDKKGKVRKVTVHESGGEQFDKAAMLGMQASSFIPAKIDGKSVTVLLRFPVKFRLL